jgi:hypothetical protein
MNRVPERSRELSTSFKSRKAASPDNIPPELFKICPTTNAKLLHPLLKTCWDNEQIPEEWKDGFIIKLPKKSDPHDVTIGEVLPYLI